MQVIVVRRLRRTIFLFSLQELPGPIVCECPARLAHRARGSRIHRNLKTHSFSMDDPRLTCAGLVPPACGVWPLLPISPSWL
jgi:hypothetical protein